jgi:hypothetical protein
MCCQPQTKRSWLLAPDPKPVRVIAVAAVPPKRTAAGGTLNWPWRASELIRGLLGKPLDGAWPMLIIG